MFYELEPIDDNILKTLIDDPLDRDFEVNKFLTILDSIGGNRCFAIDGQWGTGKTFFVKQCKIS